MKTIHKATTAALAVATLALTSLSGCISVKREVEPTTTTTTTVARPVVGTSATVERTTTTY